MLYHRPKACLALLALTAVALHSSCSTKAVGVEECRNIEYARCRAAPHCPDQFDVVDVEECRLYYRDHCLHGMPLSSPPSASEVRDCVERIDTLSDCAADEGSESGILSCGVESLRPKITTVCKLLAAPEAIKQCAFLSPETSQGGQSSTGGQSGSGGQTSTSTGNSGGTTQAASGEGGIIDLLGLGGLFQ
jgi:hypothetical protein